MFHFVSCPKMSPWGMVTDRKEVAPGVWWVATASHGGLYVSAQRLAAMPAEFTVPNDFYGYTSKCGMQWFEEDCEFYRVVMSFPDLFERPTREHARTIYQSRKVA